MACWLHMLLILLCIGLSNVKSEPESLPKAGRHLPDSEDLFIGLSYVKTEPESLREARRLPDSEVEALKEIAAQLEKNGWNFTVNPCNDPSWIRASSYGSNSTLNCNCSFLNGVCHVINMSLESNLFAGSVPLVLGNLVDLEKLVLSANNFTGELRANLTNLTKLRELDLSFNRLEGKIPDFGNLTKLTTIYLTRNLLSGPLPEWITSRDSRYQIDLSYNNFAKSSAPDTCPDNINLFRSFLESDNSMC